MDKKEFKNLIRECIKEVLIENIHPLSAHLEGGGGETDLSKQSNLPQGNNLAEDPLYVEYHSQRQGEVPFMMGGTKYEYVNAKYPDGKIDIGVYSFAGDVVYSYNAFKQRNNIKEMTGTSAVQGFYGKNWVDPDPERKRMKSIAAKSVGGKVT
jgi:hypothetical protein